MNETEALIERTFSQAYDEGRFRQLIANMMDVEVRNEQQSGVYIYEDFQPYIASYKRIGKFTDPHNNVIDVLAVKLKGAHLLERNRTMQRNFVAKYLQRRGGKDAAVVAFYADDTADWRFSLIKLELSLTQTPTGKVSTKTNLTPARRYSFLVGANEPNHTARKQLVSLLIGDANPTLEELEAKFSIENVSEEFFECYKKHYVALKETLDALLVSHEEVEREFTDREIDTTTFAKRLLGQLVFLYFLQKKGWLGVEKGADGGTGPKDFLQRAFDQKVKPYGNFFKEILEPLFYKALAVKNSDDGLEDYCKELGGKFPFLNGGLFQPMNAYNWQEVNVPVPNVLFGKILETFNTYNFTVREDEPLEKEIAVDPEMLGKVFEKLLDITDRKSKGTYYTPREIVHYMCQESLISYLDTSLNTAKKPLVQTHVQGSLYGMRHGGEQGALTNEVYEVRVPRQDIADFIHLSERYRENEDAFNRAQRKVETGRQKGTTHTSRVAASIRAHAAEVDQALQDIKICDPAIGSGAFPVGMMNEIVRARETLTGVCAELNAQAGRTPYAFKRHAIQESIYGVDIDASAVDIAKLRLWLSLVVDEEDFENIKPLPNLGYKIVVGNSVLSLEGAMKDEKALCKMEDLKRDYFDETRPSKKRELERDIQTTIHTIFKSAQDFSAQANFDFHTYFSEVFHAKGGFDVVIGNPPYVRQEALGDLKPHLKRQYESYHGSADLFVYFTELGVKLLRKGGVFSYIVANKWMRANYGKPLRTWLKKQHLLSIIDYGDLPVFENATTYPCILFASKDSCSPNKNVQIVKMDALTDNLKDYVAAHGYDQPQAELDDGGWSLASQEVQKVLDKINKVGVPLERYVDGKIYYGIKTGFNEAFVIDEATRGKLIDEDPKSAEVIKPFLAGKEVKRYQPFKGKNYLVFFPNGWTNEKSGEASDKWVWLQQQYPAIAKHLQPFEEKAEKRYDQGEYWWELRACAYYDEFEKPKIIYPNILKKPEFTFDTSCTYTNQKCFIASLDDKYFLGLLNSRLMLFLFSSYLPKLRGDFFEPSYVHFKHFPIRTLDLSNPTDQSAHTQMTERVERMLALHQRKAEVSGEALLALEAEIAGLDAEIDALVYGLYGLSEEEIEVVEASVA